MLEPTSMVQFAFPNLQSCLSLCCVLAVGIYVTTAGKMEMYSTKSLQELHNTEQFLNLQEQFYSETLLLYTTLGTVSHKIALKKILKENHRLNRSSQFSLLKCKYKHVVMIYALKKYLSPNPGFYVNNSPACRTIKTAILLFDGSQAVVRVQVLCTLPSPNPRSFPAGIPSYFSRVLISRFTVSSFFNTHGYLPQIQKCFPWIMYVLNKGTTE